MKTIKVTLTATEEILGMMPADPEIVSKFIASRSPDAKSREEEIAEVGAEEYEHNAMTVFPRDDDETPFFWDYQIKGMLKDFCGMLARAKGTKSSKLKAYRKVIDGLVFVAPRKIKVILPSGGSLGECQRSLRTSGPKGERTALSHSETAPEGSTVTFEVNYLPLKGDTEKSDTIKECLEEWLDYGQFRGLGQWRNSGKGKFTFEMG